MNEQAHHSPGTLGRPVAVMYVNVLDFTVASLFATCEDN